MSTEDSGSNVIHNIYDISETFDDRIINDFNSSPPNTSYWIPCIELKLHGGGGIWLCSKKPLNRDNSTKWLDEYFYIPGRSWDYAPLIRLLPAKFYHRFFKHRGLIGIRIAFV